MFSAPDSTMVHSFKDNNSGEVITQRYINEVFNYGSYFGVQENRLALVIHYKDCYMNLSIG